MTEEIKRIRGVLIRDGKILLIRRNRVDDEWFVIPGGGMESVETEIETLVREIGEETGLVVVSAHKIFDIIKIDHDTGREIPMVFYVVTEFQGEKVRLGGPELKRANENNLYNLEWLDLDAALELSNLYNPEIREKLKKSLM